MIAVVADIRRDVEHLRRRAVVSQAVDQAALLSPVLWAMEHPDKFDMYSAGLVLLQVRWEVWRGGEGQQQR